MTYKRLSYDMSATDPGWPGNYKMSVEPYTEITKGDVANQSKITLLNHFGSHMDGPKHFNDRGPRLAEMPLETFIYDHPLLLDIPKSYGELVTMEDIAAHHASLQQADLLMIRSGFSVTRRNAPDRYAAEGPGISSGACRFLMEQYPKLKAVAMDWISLASYMHGEDGVLAHQYLLGMYHEHYICIIEDLDFSQLTDIPLRRVIALPMFIKDADSAPVSVIVELDV
ncbi:cyclase family protein [Paenibacillus koleovorans]|uniref:cyclase family protein n=1 Tax=Paenibacillus koleovorans TaxID=121608 RepID=UPI000FDB26C1|nr:cyclase family protein [Paenibacillus koleovorans]